MVPKLWRPSDDTDGPKKEEGPGLAVRLEVWVVQFQERCSVLSREIIALQMVE